MSEFKKILFNYYYSKGILNPMELLDFNAVLKIIANAKEEFPITKDERGICKIKINPYIFDYEPTITDIVYEWFVKWFGD